MRFSRYKVLLTLILAAVSAHTFSRISRIFASVCFSSSVGFGGIFAAEANCEYVWKSVSVCLQVSFVIRQNELH